MIPIASILITKGVGSGTMIALIIGGAGASIPEVSLLGSIFKKKLVIAFLLCIMVISITTGYFFNFIEKAQYFTLGKVLLLPQIERFISF